MGKATVRRKITRKAKVNRKNKKTQRKGKKQTGGRRRPDGLETAGGGGGHGTANGNNGNGVNDQHHLNYLKHERNKAEAIYLEDERIKAKAIALIQAGKLEELRALLGQRSFSDDEALMTAVTMAKPNMDIIQEVISRTEIVDETHHKISDAIYKNSELLTEVFDLLEKQEERQKEAELLANAEPNYASHAAAAGGSPRAVANLVSSARSALAEMPPRRRLRRL